MEKNDYEFELRGKVISMSLRVENALNQIIFDFFYPKISDKKTINLYLNKIIFSFSFDKKIELFQEISKSDRYKKVLNEYLETKEILGDDKELKSYDDFIKHLLGLLRKIKKDRNTIAHGYDMSGGFTILKENEFVLSNKMKMEIFNENFLEEYSRDTLKANLMLTMVRLGIE